MAEISPVPDGFTAVTPHLAVKGCSDAIDFYGKAFGAKDEMRMPTPGNEDILMHARISIDGAMIMLVDATEEWGNDEPLKLGGSPVTIHLYTPDCDALYEQAVEAGCDGKMAPETMFWGDRFAHVVDPFGHHWTLATRVSDPAAEELNEAA
ncbi:MAG: VOC family protein, partial [Pseudomonadota bacterium]